MDGNAPIIFIIAITFERKSSKLLLSFGQLMALDAGMQPNEMTTGCQLSEWWLNFAFPTFVENIQTVEEHGGSTLLGSPFC